MKKYLDGIEELHGDYLRLRFEQMSGTPEHPDIIIEARQMELDAAMKLDGDASGLWPVMMLMSDVVNDHMVTARRGDVPARLRADRPAFRAARLITGRNSKGNVVRRL